MVQASARAQGSSVLREALAACEELHTQVEGEHVVPAFDAMAAVATRHIAGARWSSVTVRRRRRFNTEAATDDVARRADQLQYELGTGPCLSAIDQRGVVVVAEPRHDPRWPDFGARVSDELGVASMLSLGSAVQQPQRENLVWGLNVYSDQPDAFDDDAAALGQLLTSQAAASVAASLDRALVANLEQALESNRVIGVAVGIVMQRHSLSREQAFEALRQASQRSNRKLHDLAAEVAQSGQAERGTLGSRRRLSRPTQTAASTRTPRRGPDRQPDHQPDHPAPYEGAGHRA